MSFDEFTHAACVESARVSDERKRYSDHFTAYQFQYPVYSCSRNVELESRMFLSDFRIKYDCPPKLKHSIPTDKTFITNQSIWREDTSAKKERGVGPITATITTTTTCL